MLQAKAGWLSRRDEPHRRKLRIEARARTLARKNRFNGKRFGLLVILGRYSGEYFICRCDCGTEKYVQGSNLFSGSTRSCGCQHYNASDSQRENCRKAILARYARMTPDERGAIVRKAWVTRKLRYGSRGQA